jgi:predicted DNA-binding protein with PD1-like motif
MDKIMAHWEFAGSDPIDVFVDLAAGRVTLAAEPADLTTVELSASWPGRGDRLIPDVRVSFENGRLEVIGPRRAGLWRGHIGLDLAITMPAGSRCQVRTASADVSCTGDLAGLDVQTASGDVTAGTVSGTAEVTSSSGDVRLEEAAADVHVRTAGGDVRLARAGGDVTLRTASGDVTIGSAAASVTVQSASGDVRLGRVAAGRTEVTTASGDVTVGVAAGVGVYLDLASATGDVSSQLDEADASDDVALEVVCRAASGDIRITRAPGADPWPQRSAAAPPAVSTSETPRPAS